MAHNKDEKVKKRKKNKDMFCGAYSQIYYEEPMFQTTSIL